MQKIINPGQETWARWYKRPVSPAEDMSQLVDTVFNAVRASGDEAIRKFTAQFDQVAVTEIILNETDFTNAAQEVPEALKAAIQVAYNNIRLFHSSQLYIPSAVETMPGVTCWSEYRPIEKVGLYIPGGSAPLFSTLLMLGIPAVLAGCKEIVLCTPPNQYGQIDPAIIYTAQVTGISRVIKAGGIQAIAAMTFGTESVPKVHKIFGPGNQYVTAAKQAAMQYAVAIDLPAGPSEVLVIADDKAKADFVAADLLAQAEHGPDSQVMLLSTSEQKIDEVLHALETQLVTLPRKEIVQEALRHSCAVVLDSIETCLAFSNGYAPEHLILNLEQAEQYLPSVIQAGSVFVGPYSCESAGDYASGTNHTLPTNGYARNYSGVSTDSFLRKITFQHLTKKGLETIGPVIEEMAAAEQLEGHRRAVAIRR